MRISLNWLKQYVDINISPADLADRLTMVGLEVESIEELGAKYDRFFVGEVMDVSKHPKADKLVVCKVGIGNEIYQIVCGAHNVAKGHKVAVGLAGATVPKNQHDPDSKPFILSQVKLRGVDSFGMICSEYELDLGDDKDGILILSPEAISGESLAKYLGFDDVVFEVGITPNRPDAMSHIGIAREVGAFLNSKLKIPDIKFNESKKKISDYATVRIEDTYNCPRYSARVILNIRIDESPKWLQKYLTAIDIRPVNNIVDVTNYVLMECGHPLHAFDYDKITDHLIVVKPAKQGETFTTIDHENRTMRHDTLMICDGKQPIAMAGVMGGVNSEISNSTLNLLIESAYFRPQSIRRTSKHFGLSTDASQRFERGADPNVTCWALDRACRLIQQICGGEILSGTLDIYPNNISSREIEIRVEKVNEILGLSLSPQTILLLLSKFNIKQVDSSSKLSSLMKFRVPTFRPDIEREIDLIEEIARGFGYDNIVVKTTTPVHLLVQRNTIDYAEELRNIAVGNGIFEVVTNSMQNSTLASIVSEQFVTIANPLSKDMEAMRSSLVPSMLEVIRYNIDHGVKDLRLFEIGKVYFKNLPQGKQEYINGFSEEERIILAFSGSSNQLTWDQKPRFVDIFDVKGELLSLLKNISLDYIKFIPYSNTNALTEYGLTVEINGEYLGFVGVINSAMKTKFSIEQEVIVSELNIEVIQKFGSKERRYKSLPKFPSVMRDIALVIDEGVSIEKIETEIKSMSSQLLRRIQLFDIYIGDQVGKGKKSCAYSLELMAKDHTLTQVEIDNFMQSLINRLEKNLSATIRK